MGLNGHHHEAPGRRPKADAQRGQLFLGGVRCRETALVRVRCIGESAKRGLESPLGAQETLEFHGCAIRRVGRQLVVQLDRSRVGCERFLCAAEAVEVDRLVAETSRQGVRYFGVGGEGAMKVLERRRRRTGGLQRFFRIPDVREDFANVALDDGCLQGKLGIILPLQEKATVVLEGLPKKFGAKRLQALRLEKLLFAHLRVKAINGCSGIAEVLLGAVALLGGEGALPHGVLAGKEGHESQCCHRDQQHC